MTKNNQSSEKKVILEFPANKGDANALLESKGGAIPPTKVNVVMPPVIQPKKK